MAFFIYSRQMPGQVPQRPLPPPSTSQTFYNHHSVLLFDAVQAELLAVSLLEPQINKLSVRYANMMRFHLFIFLSVKELRIV